MGGGGGIRRGGGLGVTRWKDMIRGREGGK